jgi:alpha-D-xyloside xylohydrolase
MWQTAADKRVEYAEDIFSVTQSKERHFIQLLCPTRRIRSRGDTLNCPTLTIKLESEFDGVISFQVTHFTGTLVAQPNFDLFPNGTPRKEGTLSKNETGTTLKSGLLEAVVGPDPHAFDIRFKNAETGEEITSLLNRSVGFAYSPPPGNGMVLEDLRDFKHYIFTQTELAVGESIHGLGERFGPFNKLGQNIKLWNADG